MKLGIVLYKDTFFVISCYYVSANDIIGQQYGRVYHITRSDDNFLDETLPATFKFCGVLQIYRRIAGQATILLFPLFHPESISGPEEFLSAWGAPIEGGPEPPTTAAALLP